MPGATAEADDRTMSPVHATTDSEFQAALTSARLSRRLPESAPAASGTVHWPLRLHEYREMLAAFERFWLGHVRFAENA